MACWASRSNCSKANKSPSDCVDLAPFTVGLIVPVALGTCDARSFVVSSESGSSVSVAIPAPEGAIHTRTHNRRHQIKIEQETNTLLVKKYLLFKLKTRFRASLPAI